MKKLTYLLMSIAMMATGSVAFGQTDGGNDGTIQLPAVQMARSAFYASLNAYQLAQYEANYWYSMQQYHPNAATAATYFQISANYQYQSTIRLYAVWQDIEERGDVPILPFREKLAEEAKTCSLYAGWYAMVGASSVDSTWWGHHVVQAAAEAYEKAELLAYETDYY